MSKDKIKILVWFLIVIAVIIVLVFITINKKDEPAMPQVAETEQQNMPNTQQIEGVKITILKEGTGDVVKSGDTVAMNYTGKLADGTVFDSNINPKFGHVDPFIFSIGAGGVIKGWDVGVVGMKLGEKRILEISPEFAYGSTGAGEVIPPNATISFEVELLAIKK